MRKHVIELESELAASPADVWAHSTSLAGIAAELPWPLRLTTEPPVTALDEFLAADGVLGTLGIGPIPVFRWHPGIAKLGELHFIEESRDMNLMRNWRHERTIEPHGDGARLRDRVTFTPAVPGASLLVRWLFRRRHRALRRLLG
jgi:ligand-binding SRPBCC domain-containing protein